MRETGEPTVAWFDTIDAAGCRREGAQLRAAPDALQRLHAVAVTAFGSTCRKVQN